MVMLSMIQDTYVQKFIRGGSQMQEMQEGISDKKLIVFLFTFAVKELTLGVTSQPPPCYTLPPTGHP